MIMNWKTQQNPNQPGISTGSAKLTIKLVKKKNPECKEPRIKKQTKTKTKLYPG